MKLQFIRLSRKGVDTLQAPPILLLLGLPVDEVYIKQAERDREKRRRGPNWPSALSFWRKPENELLNILDKARKSYLSQMKKTHPDKGGSEAETVELNLLWSRLKYLYRQHGYKLP